MYVRMYVRTHVCTSSTFFLAWSYTERQLSEYCLARQFSHKPIFYKQMPEKIFVYGNYIILMLHGCLHRIETELKVQEAD